MVDQVTFPCDICKNAIVIGSDDRIKVVTKQTISDDFFGTLITLLVESPCGIGEIHVNIIVIDGDNRYRGHKYSAIKTVEQVDSRIIGSLRLLLSFGKDLSKVLALSLEGHSMILCGDSPTTNLWATTLQNLFALSSYTVKPWIISEEDFLKEYTLVPLESAGEFALIDTSLLKLAKKTIPEIPVVDLQKNKIHGGIEKVLTKELVTKMLEIPVGQNEALTSLVNIQIEWLRRLLKELREKLDASIIETAACPVGDLSETVIINSVLDQVLTEQVIGNLRARMREEEFEIVVAHLLREIPELEALIHSR